MPPRPRKTRVVITQKPRSSTQRPRKAATAEQQRARRQARNQRVAEKAAPLLKLHPEETAFPMDPLSFISLSRFREHKGFARDKGYNRETGEWDTSNSHAPKYYDIPVDVINGFGSHGDGTNRRPRDANAGASKNVFLQPRGDLSGDRRPTGRVPAFYFIRQHAVDGSARPRTLIGYWYFFGLNPTPPLAHQGDWVHATVLLGRDGTADAVWFSRHGITPKRILKTQLLFEGGRPVIYISKKSHGNWPTSGKHAFEQAKGAAGLLEKAGFSDSTANGGIKWDISKKLLPLEAQPWRNYAGAWGQVGEIKETTGPLGPWPKRTNK